MADVPDVIDALVPRLRTEDGLTGVGVTDGPEITSEDRNDWVLVGFDGDPEGEFRAATTEEAWAGLGSSRESLIRLTVTLLARRGDADVRAARLRVYEMAGVVRGMLRADPSLGLPGVQCAIGSTSFHQPQTADSGIQARLVLTLVCRTI